MKIAGSLLILRWMRVESSQIKIDRKMESRFLSVLPVYICYRDAEQD